MVNLHASPIKDVILAFEDDITNNASRNLLFRYGRSEAGREIFRRGRESIPAIILHLRQNEPTDVFNLRIAWGMILSEIEKDIDPDRLGPDKLSDIRSWIAWAEWMINGPAKQRGVYMSKARELIDNFEALIGKDDFSIVMDLSQSSVVRSILEKAKKVLDDNVDVRLEGRRLLEMIVAHLAENPPTFYPVARSWGVLITLIRKELYPYITDGPVKLDNLEPLLEWLREEITKAAQWRITKTNVLAA